MTPDNAAPLGERLLGIIARFRPGLPRLPGAARLKAIGPRGLGLTQPWHIFAAAGLAGLAGTAVVALLNTPAQELEEPDGLLVTGLLFVAALLAYRHLQRLVLRSTSDSVEHALDRVRTRIAGKVARLDLRGFEGIARAQLQGGLAHHYATISEATVGILTGLQSFVLLVLTLCYLATISVLAVALSLGVFVLAVQAYLAKQGELTARMRATAVAETALAASLAELMDGFKELRLDAAKRAAVLEELFRQSHRSADERAVTAGIFAEVIVFGNSVAYLMGGAVVFLLPLFVTVDAQDLPRMVAVVLFLIGPMGAVVSAAKNISTARFAINSLLGFEAEVESLLAAAPPEAAAPPPTVAFASLEARGLRYAHRPRDGEPPFVIGPLDFRLSAGEVVFVTGGNGSGKTTALRVLTGLYPPEQGELLLNGAPLPRDGSGAEAYRALFGAVFADTHVFRRPYALPPERTEALRAALAELGIAHKLPADPTEPFDPGTLSTGQRKRLALAVALAEDRPVLVLDEWAADQDPQSRERFYRELLPRLRAEGKAVLAITHDDRYFDAADRRYHMEEGRMSPVQAA